MQIADQSQYYILWTYVLIAEIEGYENKYPSWMQNFNRNVYSIFLKSASLSFKEALLAVLELKRA